MSHSKDPVLTETIMSDPATNGDVSKNNNNNYIDDSDLAVSFDVNSDDIFQRLRSDALKAEQSEPELSCLLRRTVLSPEAKTFEDAVACAVAHRMELSMGSRPDICPDILRHSFQSALKSDILEHGNTASESIREDALAYVRRDPACLSILEPVLFFKGFAATVAHRAAYRKWKSGTSRFVALWLQSQASACFGVDIHPAATIGKGVMIDHANGVVIGETAMVGDGCTILHGVTLGGTGKEKGHDRHPKVGRDVLIGANVQVLGNIRIGDGAKIGAGSVVLRPIPHGATAVGSPAKVVGWAKEKKPGEEVDQLMVDIIRAGGGNSAGGLTSAESMVSLVTTEVSNSTDSSDGSKEGSPPSSGEKIVTMNLGSSEPNHEGGLEPSSEEEDQSDGGVSSSHHEEADDEFDSKEFGIEDHSTLVESGGQRNAKKFSNRRTSMPACALSKAANGTPMFHSLRTITEMRRRNNIESDCCSMFRSFKIKNSPPGTVTYCKIRSILMAEDATDAEIGEVFFEILGKSPKPERGYIPAQTFEEEFEKAATTFTSIDPERIKHMKKKITRKRSSSLGRAGD